MGRTGVHGVATIISVILLASLVALLGATSGDASGTLARRRAEVERRGRAVMPFDQSKTVHVFEKTRTGGTQRVIARNRGDSEQIALVRDHLQFEAERFAAGDFADPVAIHGIQMPGLDALRRAARNGAISVTYKALGDGALLTYRVAAEDNAVVDALHAWFDAQVSDHGRHARGHDTRLP